MRHYPLLKWGKMVFYFSFICAFNWFPIFLSQENNPLSYGEEYQFSLIGPHFKPCLPLPCICKLLLPHICELPPCMYNFPSPWMCNSHVVTAPQLGYQKNKILTEDLWPSGLPETIQEETCQFRLIGFCQFSFPIFILKNEILRLRLFASNY